MKRRPPQRAPGHVVGIDLGASNLRYALADLEGNILSESSEKVRPEQGPGPMIAQIKEGCRRLARDGQAMGALRAVPFDTGLRALAIGVPSPVDPKTHLATFANNLPGWKDVDLGRELAKEFRVPARLENDANMAAIGEHWRGAAAGADNFVFVALGTGIGSGIFTEGKLYRGRTGAAGELFRLNVEWQRWDEEFPDTGYYEAYVSGMGIAAEGRRALEGASAASAGGLTEQRDARFVFEAFRRGDARAREVLERIFTMLGVGVANLIAILDPDLIVLGGGISRGAPDFLMSVVEKVVRRIHPEAPPVTLSALGDKAQRYGAIRCALDLLPQTPGSRTLRKPAPRPVRRGSRRRT